jgi:3-deoxy-D-manno-octulosonate 8-phosphate phosphatase (KDO 8-P phosphatase)
MGEPSAEVRRRAERIQMILLDVDGVLTDGNLYLGSDGYDGRSFHVRDGHGIRMGQRGGLLFGLISGRECKVVGERAAELYITEVHQGVYDKAERFREIVQRLKLREDEVCFVGDDLVDVPIMRLVGLAVAPADGATEARDAAHYVTERDGGRGAVREVVDLVLRASGKLEKVTERYYK